MIVLLRLVCELINCGNRCYLILIIWGWLLIFIFRHCHYRVNLIIFVRIGILVLRFLACTPLWSLRIFFVL